MKCFKSKKSKNLTPPPPSSSSSDQIIQEIIPENKNVTHQVFLRIPECKVHLMDEGEAIELAIGDFELLRIIDDNVSLATTIKVGDELQWPLTKDEPVVKLDALHYLFSLPMKDGEPLSYGVAFSDKFSGNLSSLDSFLKENSLFTCPSSSSSRRRKECIDWKEFAPRVDDYNSVLAKAIAGGTGHVVKGMFKCSNAYSNQVQKGGETILINAVEEQNWAASNQVNKSNSSNGANKKRGAINKSLKRARNLSKMTEKMSKTMLDVVGIASGSLIRPMVKSQAGKTFLSMVPGEVLLASLDAVSKLFFTSKQIENFTILFLLYLCFWNRYLLHE